MRRARSAEHRKHVRKRATISEHASPSRPDHAMRAPAPAAPPTQRRPSAAARHMRTCGCSAPVFRGEVPAAAMRAAVAVQPRRAVRRASAGGLLSVVPAAVAVLRQARLPHERLLALLGAALFASAFALEDIIHAPKARLERRGPLRVRRRFPARHRAPLFHRSTESARPSVAQRRFPLRAGKKRRKRTRPPAQP